MQKLYYYIMFGWGKKKPAPPVEEARVIQLEEAPQIAEEARARREKSAILETSKTLRHTNDSVRELRRIRQELERDNAIVNEVDKRMRPLVIRGKRMLMDALQNNAVEIKPIQDHEDMIRVSGELEHRLNKIGNILGKHTRIIHTFAEKYAARLAHILEDMDRDRNTIMKRVSQYQADSTLALNITEGVKTIHIMMDSIHENYSKGNDIITKMDTMSKDISLASGAINAFKASEEYSSLQRLRSELEQSVDARDKLANQIAAQFTKISRPLDRYMRISSDKEQKALLKRVLENPYNSMNEREMDDVLELLEGILSAVSGKSISVKDVNKAAAAITQTKNIIPNFVKSVQEAESRIIRLENQIQDSDPHRINRLQDRLDSLREERDGMETKIADLKNAAKMAAASIPQEMINIQNSLRILTGVRYTLKYNIPEM